MSDAARAVMEKVKAELPDAWLGGRQRVVLEDAIEFALREAEARGLEAAAKLVEKVPCLTNEQRRLIYTAADVCTARAAALRKETL